MKLETPRIRCINNISAFNWSGKEKRVPLSIYYLLLWANVIFYSVRLEIKLILSYLDNTKTARQSTNQVDKKSTSQPYIKPARHSINQVYIKPAIQPINQVDSKPARHSTNQVDDKQLQAIDPGKQVYIKQTSQTANQVDSM